MLQCTAVQTTAVDSVEFVFTCDFVTWILLLYCYCH